MEACPGSQWLARKLQAMGYQVRIVPAQFVKPYVKSQKNDTIDAEAIAEAVTRPTMRFTQVRTVEQVDLQALHRIRDQLVSSRTRLINQVRAFCLEYGVAIRQGAGVFRLDLPRVLADETNDLSPAMRRMLTELFEDVVGLDRRIAGASREIEALAACDDRARRLMTVPGIGPLGATALLAAIGDGRQFRRARDLAAWLGLVPAGAFDRRQDHAPRDQQTGQPIRQATTDPRGALLRDTPRSRAGPSRRMARRPAEQDAREQGHCSARGEDGSDGMGNPHQAWRALRTQGSGPRLKAAVGQKARLGK